MTAPSLVVHTEPQCLILRDAIATPFELVAPADAPEQPPRHASFKAYTRGCLYEADGARVELSIRVGGIGGDQAASIDPAILPPEQRGGSWLTGRTLYLGPCMNHYGHFITEGLSRYWKQDIGPVDHVVAYPFMHNGGNILIEDFHRHLAGLLDVPIDRMAILRSQTVFDEIVVPEQLWPNNVQVNAHMRSVYERIRARHAGRKSSGRLFLSRPASKRLGNPLAVEEAFASFGFRVIYPERIPIAEQLALYANCEVLASLSGSGMHNCLFARPGLMTIEVGDTPRAPQPGADAAHGQRAGPGRGALHSVRRRDRGGYRAEGRAQEPAQAPGRVAAARAGAAAAPQAQVRWVDGSGKARKRAKA